VAVAGLVIGIVGIFVWLLFFAMASIAIGS
jgi:hypothetical protein